MNPRNEQMSKLTEAIQITSDRIRYYKQQDKNDAQRDRRIIRYRVI